jgi:hypothetical protein
MRIAAKKGAESFLGEKFWISLGIGVITALVLTWIRGGFDDAPWILIEFGLVGFLISYLTCWLTRPATLGWIESAFNRIPYSSHLRGILALALTVSLVFWSGPVIATWGYGSWLLAILFCVLAPLIICLLTARFPIVLGMVAATSVVFSVLLENTRFELARSRFQKDFCQQFWQSFQLGEFVVVWLIALALSLIVSLPIHLQMEKMKSSKP